MAEESTRKKKKHRMGVELQSSHRWEEVLYKRRYQSGRSNMMLSFCSFDGSSMPLMHA